MGAGRCHGKEHKEKVHAYTKVSIVYDLQSVDIPVLICGGMRGGAIKKPGIRQVEGARMNPEGKTDEREASRRDPVRLKLLSANPDYTSYTCLAQDVHVLGKVLWVVRRV